jgi:hypothetical protein
MPTSEPHSALARWSPSLKNLRALSLKQPWAWLVVNGYKDIENRDWRTHHRGALLIHASMSKQDFSTATLERISRRHGVVVPSELDIGGIVGVVDVADCVTRHRSKWFAGEYGWILENPRRLPFRECKGFVKFFRPELA